jgi:sugar/nucleoside kinase (ribokinase family)
MGFRTDVLSTLGAGDVFHGALLAAVVRGLALPACLSYANVVAALSCHGLDGRTAIPTHAEAAKHVSALTS